MVFQHCTLSSLLPYSHAPATQACSCSRQVINTSPMPAVRQHNGNLEHFQHMTGIWHMLMSGISGRWSAVSCQLSSTGGGVGGCEEGGGGFWCHFQRWSSLI
jgi:hypothetical protein